MRIQNGNTVHETEEPSVSGSRVQAARAVGHHKEQVQRGAADTSILSTLEVFMAQKQTNKKEKHRMLEMLK